MIGGCQSYDSLMDVSRETIVKLEVFSGLLQKWTKSINLIAPSSVENIWARHIVDSAQLYHLAPKAWNKWVDLGSGGGLPGIVIAILDDQSRPVTLIESDKRKCLFLDTVRRELSLNISVQNARIEACDLDDIDIVSARALAPLTNLLNYAGSMLSLDGIALFPKGAQYQSELEHAQKNWHFEVEEHQSQTNADSRVLRISRIRPRES